MADYKIQGEASLDVSKAEGSLNKLGQTAERTTQTIAQQSQKASKAAEGIGDGINVGAQKFTRAESQISASIKRATTQLEMLGKTASQRLEFRISERGLDASKFEPALKKLRELEAAQKNLNESTKSFGGILDGATGSVARFAAAAAGAFSAQAFIQTADAVTRLENQLKLAVGGVVEAQKAYKELFEIAQRSRVNFTELGGTFASVSRAAGELGLSQRQLLSLTEAIGNAVTVSGASAQASNAALTQLSQGLASGVLRGEELNSIMEQTPRLARAIADGLGVPIGKLRELGQAGELSAQRVIEALKSQANVLQNEVQNSVLTVGQAYTQLENSVTVAVGELDKATGVSKAVAEAIGLMSSSVTDAGKAFRDNREVILGTLGVVGGAALAAGALKVAGSIGAITVAFKALGVAMAANPAGLALLGIGAATGGFIAYNEGLKGTREGLAAAIRDLEDTNRSIEKSIYGKPSEAVMKQVEDRKRQIREMRQALALMDSETLDTSAEDARLRRYGAGKTQEDARAKLMADRDAFLQKQSGVPAGYVKDVQELIRLNQAGVLVGDEYVKALKRQQDQLYKGAGGGGSAKQANRDLEDQAQLLSKLSGLSSSFYRDWELLNKAYASGKLSLDGLTEAQRALLADQPFARDLAKEQADAFRSQEEAMRALAKAEEDRINSATRSAVGVEDQVQKLLDEEKALGIAAAKNISLAQAIEEVAIARLREAQSKLMAEGDRDSEVLAIQREIDARKQLKEAIGREESRKASEDAAKAAEAEWKKTAESIESSLTDALLRGFESGKSIAENFRDVLVNTFKTLVLRPLIQPVASGLANSLLGAFGGGGGSIGGIGSSILGGGGNGILGSLGGVAGGLGSGFQAGFGALLNGGGIEAVTTGISAAFNGGTLASAAGGIGTALGAALPVAGILAGVSSLLEKRIVGQGFGVYVGNGQFGGAYDWTERKGQIGGGKTSVRDGSMDPQALAFVQQARAVSQAAGSMAGALGLTTEGIQQYTGALRVNLEGVKSAEEAQQRINKAIDDLQFAMLSGVEGFDMTRKEFEKLMNGVRESMDAVGISSESLAEVITQGMIGKISASQVGEQLSDIVIGGIYDSIASSYAGQIANVFTAQIITPIFTALAAGVPISQAISQQAIDSVVNSAKQAADQLNAVFSDPGFRQAIAGVQEAIGGIAAASGSVNAPAYRSAASSYNAAAEAAKRAADEIKRAWQGIADSLLEEIRRIRGEIVGDTSAGFAYNYAQFTTATAQARAGNQRAADRLPELSQAVIELASNQAASLSDLNVIRGQILSSLAETRRIIGRQYGLALPQFDVGTNYVPRDMVAKIHEGEAIIPKKYNPAAGGSGDNQTVQQLAVLNAQVEKLTVILREIESDTSRMDNNIDGIANGTNVIATEAA
jgi:tape measure domain-containing protein